MRPKFLCNAVVIVRPGHYSSIFECNIGFKSGGKHLGDSAGIKFYKSQNEIFDTFY